MSNFNKNQQGYNQNKNKGCECNEIPYLDDLNDYDKVKSFLLNIEQFTEKCLKRVSYTKVRKYYDKILKVLEKEKEDINKLKSYLSLEVGILIDYDIGRAKEGEKNALICLKEFFKKTLELLDKENDIKLFEKNWETLIAYAKKI